VHERKLVRARVVDLPRHQPVERPLNGTVFADGLAPLAGDDDGDLGTAVDVEVVGFPRPSAVRRW
jgi:hypothetical protein